MKMKTDRGKRKVGRRLGLPAMDRKRATRHVSLSRPVETSDVAPKVEEERQEAPAPTGDEQP